MVVSYRGFFSLLVFSLATVLVSFFYVLHTDTPLLLGLSQDHVMHGAGEETNSFSTITTYGSGRWLLLRQEQTSLAASYHTSWCQKIIQSGLLHRCFLDETAFVEWSFFSLSGIHPAFTVQHEPPFVTYRWLVCDASHCLSLRGYIQRIDPRHTHILGMAFSLVSHGREDGE
ncbi:MAG: hypothetical protein NZL83_01720 [Candidatus Absconditabacterales bacterium]|nr:hypothetical protein [Candidatus Absconditabacterales bacterium]